MQTMPSLVWRPCVFLNSFLLKLNKNMGVEGAAGNLLFVLLKCCISQQSSSCSAWRYFYIRTTVGLTQFGICRQMDVLCWGLSTKDCETTNYNPAAFSYLDFSPMCLWVLPCSQAEGVRRNSSEKKRHKPEVRRDPDLGDPARVHGCFLLVSVVLSISRGWIQCFCDYLRTLFL